MLKSLLLQLPSEEMFMNYVHLGNPSFLTFTSPVLQPLRQSLGSCEMCPELRGEGP